MKAVILAGGFGTRISEETYLKPKPMIEIGGKPILWHIMKIYSAHDVNDFVICCGYKGYVIKEYFANYFLHMSDVTFDMTDNSMVVHGKKVEPWRVTMVDTGENTLTGGRLRRVANYVKDEEAFCFTYGDGVSNVNVRASIEFHRRHGRLATVTAVLPPGRFGALERSGDQVTSFIEKPRGDGGLAGSELDAPVRDEVERVVCNAVCTLNGALADPELRGNFVVGVFCNAVQDEHETTKYVEASMNVPGIFDQ